MSDLDDFEAMAERFRKETGYTHPGKDEPSSCAYDAYEVRAAVLGVWQRMTEKAAALQKQNAALREVVEWYVREMGRGAAPDEARWYAMHDAAHEALSLPSADSNEKDHA